VSRAKSDLATIEKAVDRYAAAIGSVPTTEQGLTALLAPPSGVSEDKWHAGGGPYIHRPNFNDPWGHPYVYQATDDTTFDVRSHGEGKGDITTKGGGAVTKR
jgi:general secretion pathway protein G